MGDFLGFPIYAWLIFALLLAAAWVVASFLRKPPDASHGKGYPTGGMGTSSTDSYSTSTDQHNLYVPERMIRISQKLNVPPQGTAGDAIQSPAKKISKARKSPRKGGRKARG